jgi:hypothetical protein
MHDDIPQAAIDNIVRKVKDGEVWIETFPIRSRPEFGGIGNGRYAAAAAHDLYKAGWLEVERVDLDGKYWIKMRGARS